MLVLQVIFVVLLQAALVVLGEVEERAIGQVVLQLPLILKLLGLQRLAFGFSAPILGLVPVELAAKVGNVCGQKGSIEFELLLLETSAKQGNGIDVLQQLCVCFLD